MKKPVCKIKDIIDEYKHLLYLDYKNKYNEFYCPLDRALKIIGFELVFYESGIIGKYSDIKSYLELDICRVDSEKISEEELNKIMKKLIKSNKIQNITDLLDFCYKNEILIVRKKNKKFIEDIIELENGEIQYTYDDCYSKTYKSKSYSDFISKIMFFQY